jgi:glycerophosphoryl diester phosphodiesterase
MAGLTWLIERPVAHRGLHGGTLIENTLGAASAAVAANYALEVDLQLSADGEVVVFHDTTLDRLTDATGPLAARKLAELKTVAFRSGNERIPTLQELLDTVAGRTPLILELKSEGDGDMRLPQLVAKILASYAGPVAAMSFDPAMVLALQEYAPGLPRGIVAERYYTKPHFVAYYVRDLPAMAPLFARHVLGMKLLTWTVRSEQERKRARWWAQQMIFEGFRP